MTPDLTVVLAASGGFDAVRRTVRRLARQSAAERVELIVVGFSGPLDVPASLAQAFWAVQTIGFAEPVSVARANAAGARAARAAIVAFSEDHCFPEPGWADALIEAHKGGWAAVGPQVRNGNPASAVSWADYLIGYGPWMEPSRAGERAILPGHNSCYRKAELVEYGERLEAMLESETVLHYDLGARGKKLYLEPRACVSHVNFGLLGTFTRVQFYCGWVFAGYRGRQWGLGKRLFYAAASPLIPLVRLARIGRELTLEGRPLGRILTAGPALLWGLMIDGLGQFTGYLAGPGRSAEVLAAYEYNRVRYITEADRREMDSADA